MVLSSVSYSFIVLLWNIIIMSDSSLTLVNVGSKSKSSNAFSTLMSGAKIKPFIGGNADVFNVWWMRFKHLTTGASDEEKLQLLNLYLDGSAALWFATLSDEVRIDFKKCVTALHNRLPLITFLIFNWSFEI